MSVQNKQRGKHCGPRSDYIGAVWSGSTLFIYDASNSLVDDKKHTFVIMRFKG